MATILGTACSGSAPAAGSAPADLSIAPNVGYTGEAVAVVISGSGFLANVSEPQGGGSPIVDTETRAWLGSTELSGVTWVGTSTLTATVPAGLAPGTYDLTVENALGNSGSAKSAYTELAEPTFATSASVIPATVDVGQTMVLTVTVANNGDSAITGLELGIPTVSSSDGGSAGPPSAQPSAPSTIAAGQKLSFSWTFTPTAPGHVSISVDVAGVDSATGTAMAAALAAPAQALIELPAALTATWVGPPSTETIGAPVPLTLELANAVGGATAEVAGVTPSVSPSTNVSCTAVDPVPSTAVPVQILGGASARFTWSCTATAFGDYAFSASVAASDQNSGGPISVAPVSIVVDYTTALVLTVVSAGTGSGTVSSVPAGIAACGQANGICTAQFLSGTVVTLTAIPAAGSTMSWSGCTPTGVETECTVAIDGAKIVTATFTLSQESLTVTPPSNGTITCTGGCAASYGFGSTVTLTASPHAGFTFEGWTGACSGSTTASCTLTMTSPMTVGATFGASQEPLALLAIPAGGTSGFTCSLSGAPAVPCLASYPAGSVLTIAAPPATGFTFVGWSGGICTGPGVCSFSIPAGGATVIATFATVPGAPTGVVAVAGNTSATVSWSAPTSNGGSSITGYTVTSNPGGSVATTSGALSATMSGLTNGVSYTFTVAATNAVGTGPASPASNSVTPGTVPGAPTGVAAVAGNTAATVTWTAPASSGGSAITGYTVTSNPGGLVATTSGALTATVSGLTNGVSYTFTVTATNAFGTGPPSTPSGEVAPGTVPGAPTGVVAVAGTASAVVAWSAPVSDGGSAVTGYTVTSNPGGLTASTSGALLVTVSGLTGGVMYTFTVTAANAFGTGPASAPSNAIVVPGM